MNIWPDSQETWSCLCLCYWLFLTNHPLSHSSVSSAILSGLFGREEPLHLYCLKQNLSLFWLQYQNAVNLQWITICNRFYVFLCNLMHFHYFLACVFCSTKSGSWAEKKCYFLPDYSLFILKKIFLLQDSLLWRKAWASFVSIQADDQYFIPNIYVCYVNKNVRLLMRWLPINLPHMVVPLVNVKQSGKLTSC